METTGASGTLLSRYAYSYDAEGRIAAEDALTADGSGAEHRMARAFAYDGEGRLSSCEASGTEGAFTEAYSYNAAGNRARLVRTGDGADDVRYSYDADDRLVREVSASHGTTTYDYDAAGQLASKRADGEGETIYDYGVEGRLLSVRQGGRALMAAAYDGDGRRVMQASPYHEQVEGTDGSGMGDAVASEGDAGQEGLSPWSLGLSWYGFAAGGAAALSAPNPAVMAHAVEGACALVEASWPDGAFDPAAADLALSHLGLPALDLAAMTGGYGIGEPGRTDELLDVVTYASSSVIGSVSQVAFSHSTRSGDSIEAYGLDRLSKSEDGATASYICDGRGSVAQALTGAGSVSSWHMWGAFGEQEAGSSLGELPSYGYNAEEAHPQTGLQYLRARYYDASTGRFGVQDSYLGDLSDPLTLNRYLYCLADPLNLIDPTGHAAAWTRLYNPFTTSVRDRYTIFKASIGVPQGGRIYGALPIGVWNVTETMARLTTFAGLMNWKAIESRRPGYAAPAGYKGSTSYADWARLKALQLQMEVRRIYCGSAEKLVDYRKKTQVQFASDMEQFHMSLDFAGIFNPVHDVENVIYYGTEGDFPNAFLSALAVVPVVDWVVVGGRAVKYSGKLAAAAQEARIAAALKAMKPDSKVLAKNMEAAGRSRPDEYHTAAHHIVAGAASGAEESRKLLAKWEIDINDASNGVYLPDKDKTLPGTYHPSMHTTEYYRKVNEQLGSAQSREEAIDILNRIGKELESGAF